MRPGTFSRSGWFVTTGGGAGGLEPIMAVADGDRATIMVGDRDLRFMAAGSVRVLTMVAGGEVKVGTLASARTTMTSDAGIGLQVALRDQWRPCFCLPKTCGRARSCDSNRYDLAQKQA